MAIKSKGPELRIVSDENDGNHTETHCTSAVNILIYSDE